MSEDPETLTARVRDALSERHDVQERRMMGGLVFMVAGHMCCGVDRHGLMVRVGPDAHDEALAEPDASPMDLTGRPMHGFVLISQTALRPATARLDRPRRRPRHPTPATPQEGVNGEPNATT